MNRRERYIMERVYYRGTGFGGWHLFYDTQNGEENDFRYAVADDGTYGVGFPRQKVQSHDLPERFLSILKMVAFPHIL